MRKNAIFNFSGIAEHKGGPAGYLFHLFSGFRDNKPDFLCMHQSSTATNKQKGRKSFINSLSFLFELKYIFSIFKKGRLVRKKFSKTINNYDLIHIHDSESVLYIRDFARFKGNIVLTSHRPEPLEDEIINALKNRFNYSFPILRRILRRVERRSYKLADAFIFPSENAAKIYNDFPGFEKNSKHKPIKYLITGLNPTPSEVSRIDYFKKHNITFDINKPIVTYIGRHNRIKGYDRVIESFNTIKSNNACVLVAGAQGALMPPVDDAWIELGYITDTLDLMYISDLVLIPNRNTYFDLVIIEALSMGKIVLTSNTGGNIDIAKDCKGMILFDNMVEGSCEQKLNMILTMPREKRQELENSSLSYYNKYCKPSIFASKYNEVISLIYKDLSEHKS